MGILRKNQEEMLEIKTTVTELENVMGSLVDWKWLKKKY
jgi:hypothetical protein